MFTIPIFSSRTRPKNSDHAVPSNPVRLAINCGITAFMKYHFVCITLLLLNLPSPPRAWGQTLYASGPGGGKLLTINPITGVGTAIGPFTAGLGPTGIDFRSGKLY